MRLLLLVAISVLFAYISPLAAQDFSNKGKEFWLAYSYHVGMANTGGGSPTMTLYLTSDVTTTYTVEVFGAATIQNGTVAAGQVQTVVVPNSYFINNEGAFTNRAIRVTAEKPIVVYSFITRSAASAATLCLPVNVLGKEYVSSNFTQIANENSSNSYFTIVAVEDNTTVQITPSANTKNGWLANSIYTVSLNKGGIYQVLGAPTSNSGGTYYGADLSGSKIQSIASGTGGCKRIAVFSGAGKISIGCDNGSADNLYQQLYPTATWGKKYLTTPSYQRPFNYFRIIKSTASASVYLNGTLIPAGSFTNGVYYQFINNVPNRIEADQPISVSQYFTSQGCAGNPSGGANNQSVHYDPDMIVLNPVEQNIDRVTLVNTALVNSPAQHHVHAIMRNTGTGLSSFKVDGSNVPLSSWTVHPADPSYSYIYLSNVSQGFHRLESDSGFNALAYGYANAETYGYSAGANVKDLYQFVSIQNQYAIVNFPSTCTNAPFYFSMTFPYQPSEIRWVFGATLNAMGITDVTVTNPVFDSTWTLDGKQLYRYKLLNSYTITAIGTYPIKVFALSPTGDGCNGEQEINYDIQVFNPPTADFTFTATGCLSDSVRFTDVSNNGGRTPIKWFWDFADGNASQIRNPAHLYAAPGSYIVKFSTVTDIGCLSDTAKKTVVITDPPIAKFGIATAYCEDKPLLFVDSSTSLAPITKWTWNFGDGSQALEASTNASQPHTFTNFGSFTISLMVETASGCKSIAFTKTIYVSPNPTAAFSFSKACLPNQLVQFGNQSAIVNGNQSNLNFQWAFGDGGTSQDVNPSHLYTSTGPFSTLLIATSATGCVDSIRKMVDSIYAQPQARFTAPDEICLGTVASFNSDASTASGSTVTAWAWTFGDGVQSAQKNPTHTYTAAGSFEVALTVTSAFGCVSTLWKDTVIVNALPAADFTPSNPTCAGQTISFSDVSIPGSGQVNGWAWNFGDGGATSTAAAPSHIYSTAGNYTVTLSIKTDKGCSSTVHQETIRINSNPKAGFTLPGNCVNDPVSQFTDTSTIADGTQAQFAHLWNFGDPNATPANPNISTASPGAHKYTATGNYNVKLVVTSNAGCSDSITQVFTINGAVPVPAFIIQGGNEHCSNDSVVFVDNSSVTPGRLVKLEIYWDYAGDPTIKTVANYPASGTRYAHLYPQFFSPATRTFRVKYVAYSGQNCLTEIDTAITLKATPQIIFPAIDSICLDASPVQIQASVTNLPGGNFQFTGTGITTTGLFNPRTAGIGTFAISYRYTAANGCINQSTQSVTVNPVPTVNAGPDRFVLEGGAVTLAASATGNGLTYTWSPVTYLSNPAILQPVAMPKDDIGYTLTVTTPSGCSATDNVFITLLKAPTIPNAFTPNGDNINDRWVIQYLDSYPGATVEVFNRYGSLIYRSTGYTTPWDGTFSGKPAPAGTYYYIINPKNGRAPLSGFVDIVR